MKLVAGCAFIAALGAYGLGIHYQDANPVFGGGQQVIDYIPSDIEQQHAFWKVFLILTLSSITGFEKGLQSEKWKAKD